MAGNDAAIEAVRNVLSRLRKRRGLRSDRLDSTEIDAAALLDLRVIAQHADHLGVRRQDAVVPVIRDMVRRLAPTDRLIADTELALGLLEDTGTDHPAPAHLYAEDLGARREYLCLHWRALHEAVHADTVPPAPTLSQLRRTPEHHAFTELARLLVEGTPYGSHPLATHPAPTDPATDQVHGRVTVVGDAVIDHLYRVETIPRAHSTVTGSFIAHPGGKGLSRAVALARLGLEVHLMAAVGDDDAGRRILEFLREQHVRTDLVKIVPSTPTPVTAVIVAPTGEQTIIACKADPAVLTAEDLAGPAAHRALAEADAVLMSFEQPVPILEHVLATLGALEHPPTLIVHAAPPVTRPERLYPHLRVVDYLIGSGEELRRLTGADAAAWQLRMHGVRTVCTLEDFGCSVRSDHLDVEIPPFPTLLTGSPGAHAAFSAALAYRLLRSRRPADRGDFTWATAAMVATQSLDDVPSAMPAADRIDHIVKLAAEER
ncbi:PfkB family carbohydrate kinase [Nocardia macrotermitis]|uniref:Sulfofructose kinase n=1 Tax=Nocardia macrotermitis TaxID=2585198 RepID=A0A7K0D911_9NOCA|nr:PfkB family carbohydrate kinase [Nocardia macrotermitis]MQY22198.1 Sulfofructose kinase [Nocardia macrotermitis]